MPSNQSKSQAPPPLSPYQELMLVAERRRAVAAAAKTAIEESPAEKTTVPEKAAVPFVVEKGTVVDSDIVNENKAVTEKGTVVEKITVVKSPIKRATRVQDGHSTGEQCVYAAMWQQGEPEEGGRSRLMVAGWDRLGAMANLTWKNARSAVFRLIDKLAVEVVAAEDSNSRTGRTYRVWGWIALLEHRRAAGMEWYVKTRGVEFVRPPADCPDAQVRWDTHHGKKGTVVDSELVSEKTTVPFLITVPEKETVSVVFSTTPSYKTLKEEEIKESNPSSSSFSEVVAQAIRRLAPDADDDFVSTLIGKCRAVAPDATGEEIAYFIRAKGEKALNSRRVSSLTGFLLTAVPKCLQGTLLEDYREGKRQERAQEITAWREMLADPDSTDEIRQTARNELIRLGG